jgi:hypothetical protein
MLIVAIIAVQGIVRNPTYYVLEIATNTAIIIPLVVCIVSIFDAELPIR